jgi:phosphohistidine phosphatase SixA
MEPFMRLLNRRILLTGLSLVLAASPLSAQTLQRIDLAAALRDGGFVIVMRHANSPRETPDAASANPDNIRQERQLDEAGRRDASAMGAALKRLRIPVNEVLSSPTYRALETARLLDVGTARPMDELSNEGMAATTEARAAWLRGQVAKRTAAGQNRLLITHGPNISAAFPNYSAGMAEGEALIFDPRGMNGPVMIQRIRIGDWAGL